MQEFHVADVGVLHADTHDYAGFLIGLKLQLDGVPFRVEGISVCTATLHFESLPDADIILSDVSNIFSIHRASDCIRGETRSVAYARMEVLVSSFIMLTDVLHLLMSDIDFDIAVRSMY